MGAARSVMLEVLLYSILASGAAAQNDSAGRAGAQTQPGKQAERDGWAIKTEADAVAKAREIVGLADETRARFSAELKTLAQDNTPFLHDQIVGRPIWDVVIAGWKLALKSAPADEKDRYSRVFDILIDPTNGRLLKASSRWPEGAASIAPEPSAESAEEQMGRSDEEQYHSFPDVPAKVNLIGALEAVQRSGGGGPYLAKQIVAHYVMRSTRSGKPRAVWAITLRGIPPFQAAFPGVPVDARNHMRTVIDAETGKCLGSSTTPQPDTTAPAARTKSREE